MKSALLLASLRLDAVIDRVEGTVAVLEWRDGLYADVPLAILPIHAGEGDRVLLLVWAAPDAAAWALDAGALDLPGDLTPAILRLPPEAHLEPGRAYHLEFQYAAAGPVGWTSQGPDAGVSP